VRLEDLVNSRPPGFFRDKRCLVTGGAGFIGSHLVDALVGEGAVVTVLDDLSNGKMENLERSLSRVSFTRGDIRDIETCRGACRGQSLVFHQAALGSVPRSMKDPATSLAVNVQGTAHVLAASMEAGVDRVVYASSSSVYGDTPKLPKREGEEGRPLSPYALSKVMNEQLAEVFRQCYGMAIVGLRYFNVYGSRQDPDGPYAAVIPRFFRAFLRGEAPVIYGDGEQSRDFTYVADAVRANLLAATAPVEACGRAYNVAGGKRITVTELAKAIQGSCGSKVEPIYEPERPGDIKHSLADLSQAAHMLGYSPATEIRRGLAETGIYYRHLMSKPV